MRSGFEKGDQIIDSVDSGTSDGKTVFEIIRMQDGITRLSWKVFLRVFSKTGKAILYLIFELTPVDVHIPSSRIVAGRRYAGGDILVEVYIIGHVFSVKSDIYSNRDSAPVVTDEVSLQATHPRIDSYGPNHPLDLPVSGKL
jgi:hypothetical protein